MLALISLQNILQMLSFYKVFVFTFFVISSISFSQTIEIEGLVRDYDTNEAIDSLEIDVPDSNQIFHIKTNHGKFKIDISTNERSIVIAAKKHLAKEVSLKELDGKKND